MQYGFNGNRDGRCGRQDPYHEGPNQRCAAGPTSEHDRHTRAASCNVMSPNARCPKAEAASRIQADEGREEGQHA